MDTSSKFNVEKLLKPYWEKSKLPQKMLEMLQHFFETYLDAVKPETPERYIPILTTFMNLLNTQLSNPFTFEPFHECIRKPFDYFMFGLDFFRPLVNWQTSYVVGRERLEEIAAHIKKGHNVIFLANHQIEADTGHCHSYLEKDYPELAEKMIFIAGERVITDLFAIPFSMGCNLLCIYSKRYIDNPPELKEQKLLHNKKTMQLMSQLLTEGGKCIYVAPSGGRDRKNAEGVVEIAPFDPIRALR